MRRPSPALPIMPTALLLGATGLVGGHALRAFLDATDADGAPRWDHVSTLGRRPMDSAGARHVHHVVDFDRLDDAPVGAFDADTLVCALGTTIRQAGSREAFRRVDLEIPFEVAQRAHAAGATQMLLVSALGASESSAVFYNRVKGEAERHVQEVGFESVQLLRPSLLTGERDETRVGERIAEAVLTFARPLLVGPLKTLRPTPAADVGRALAVLAARRPRGIHVYEPPAIRAWSTGAAQPAGPA